MKETMAFRVLHLCYLKFFSWRDLKQGNLALPDCTSRQGLLLAVTAEIGPVHSGAGLVISAGRLSRLERLGYSCL